MTYEKETFLNTEELIAKYGKEGAVKSSLPSGKRVGGVRFRLEFACVVRFEISFSGLDGSYVPYVDGVPVGKKKSPAFCLSLSLEKGSHIFDLVSDGNHKGAALSVAGASVKTAEPYRIDIGSAYLPTRAIAFVKAGERTIEKYERSNMQTTVSEMSVTHVDAAFYYNKSSSAYASDLVLLSATTDSAVKVITGEDEKTIAVNGLKDCALIDGLGLSAGADFLAAVADANGVLRFYAFPFGGTPTVCARVIEGVTKVKSAGRGSLLMYANQDGVWKAMRFWQGGLESLVCGSNYFPYDELSVVKNKTHAPTCNVDVDMRYPFFYYKKPSNALVKRNAAGEERVICYADAYVSGAFAGFTISENDVGYME